MRFWPGLDRGSHPGFYLLLPDNPAERRGGRVRDNSLCNLGAQKSASKKTFIDRKLRNRSFCGILLPDARKRLPQLISRWPNQLPNEMSSAGFNPTFLATRRMRVSRFTD